jgi:hypothetical protein
MLLVFFRVLVLYLMRFRLDNGLWMSYFIQCG